MKLSKREKFLILLLIVTVVGYFGYKYIPTLNLFNLDELRMEHSQKQKAYDEMSQNIIMKNKYEEKVQTLSAEINSLNVISDLRQENVIVFLSNYFADNNIDASNVSFTDAAVSSADIAEKPAQPEKMGALEIMMNEINGGEIFLKEAGQNGNSEDKPEKQLPEAVKMTANVTFESTYNDMLNFIDAIQKNPVDISITNINTLSPGENILQGNMMLNFYQIPKPDGFTETNPEWIWNELTPFGKNNPFSVGGGALLGVSGSSYDFYMSVVPESSDLPTVMLGKAGDAERATYVYADNNTVENISFVFKTENDKFYYRYGTKNGSYPAAGGWAEFTPVSSGNVYVKIYSAVRNSDTDSSGVNINITNTSGLRIRFDIEDDDSSKPRVFFKDPKGLTVTRK